MDYVLSYLTARHLLADVKQLNIIRIAREQTGFLRFDALPSETVLVLIVISSLLILGLLIPSMIYVAHWLVTPNERKVKNLAPSRLEDIVCQTNTGIWQINLRTGKMDINAILPKLAKISAIKKETKFQDIMVEMIHPDDMDLAEEKFLSVIKGKDEYFFMEVRIAAKLGGYFWATVRGTILKRDYKGIPLIIGGTLQDISIRKEREMEIQRLSFFDPLTGLKNRRAYEEAVLSRDLPENLPISIVSADVNGLKIINDAFGHNVGDELLIRVSSILKEVFRCSDCIFRIGGDEFVVILPKMSEEKANELCDVVRSDVEKNDYHGIRASISIGVKTKKTSEENLKELLINAEVEMYHNKLHASWKNRGDIIRLILSSLFSKSPIDASHSASVAEYARKIGLMYALSDDEIKALSVAAEFHDIGKIAISQDVLYKIEPLSVTERRLIRQHVEYGYRILSGSNDYEEIAKDVLFHHEHWDGTGYPKGLKGDEIPLFSRIIRVAETYDKLRRDLPYRPSLTNDQIRETLLSLGGTKLDPEIVKRFVSVFLKKQSS